jgi:hypothetical protein
MQHSNYTQVLTHPHGWQKLDPHGTPLPPLNYELLRDIVAWAADDHARLDRFFGGAWEQEAWSRQVTNGVCQTSYCIAGQAVVQVGYGLEYEEEFNDEEGHTVWSATFCAPQVVVGVDENGKLKYELINEAMEPIEDVGRKVLGLTPWEASQLFYAGNDLAQVARYANQYAEARGLPPVYETDDVRSA